MITINNKTALIIGAISGIGQEISIQLAKEKCNLILVDKNEVKVNSLRKSLEKLTTIVNTYIVDFNNYANSERISNLIRKQTQNLDILIHCEGTINQSLIENSSVNEFNNHIAVNLFAPFIITSKLLTLLIKSQGQIVFINSSIIKRAVPKLGLYSASKHALKGMADSLREEVNPYGIRVINIYPGQTATRMQKTLYKLNKKKYNPDILIQPQDIAETVIFALKLSKTAEITDISIRPMIKS
jgi:short-subunit dehydrogenase